MISIQKPTRNFVAEGLAITWESILPYFETLLNDTWLSVSDVEKWLQQRSELEAILEEDFAWRYIRMTCDTSNDGYQEAFSYFATEIEPKLSEYGNKLNEKLLASEFQHQLDLDVYGIYLRALRNQFELFREENIPLFTELQLLQQKYAAIAGAMSIEDEGRTFTLEQAANFLKDTHRETRERIYHKIQARRLEDKNPLNNLFNELIALRHRVAINAGFDNYRDYMFKALGRFDYTAEDCLHFHEAIAEKLMPLMERNALQRKTKLGYETLRPYDTEVDPSGLAALQPFDGPADLIEKSITCFSQIRPSFGSMLAAMRDNGLIDLESRMGKAPGGYNYPLAETGAPFIFMNSANAMRDLTTMVHEGGHAVHTFLSKDLLLNDFKHAPSEIAEVASMSMELMSMDTWNVFFDKEEDLKRAKEEQLKDCLKTLPWVACIDAFQHWIYTNPSHSTEEREQAWKTLFERFSPKTLNWDGLEEIKLNIWQKQLHLFEVPFYYIEYGIAQLAAIGIYRNYKQNKENALMRYEQALSLGYTRSIPQVYAAAGIEFDFSAEYIGQLVEFMEQELDALQEKK